MTKPIGIKSYAVKLKPASGAGSALTSGLGLPAAGPAGAQTPMTARPKLPTASAPAPTPFNPGISGLLDQQQANIAAALKNTTAGISQAEDRGANDFGYNVAYSPTVGANGERTVTGVSVDPSNPFSRAALLQRSHDDAQRSATNSYAASGQLYSGALQNAQDENARNFQQGDNTLRQAFADFILGNESKRNAAVQAANEGNTAAFAAALNSQLATTPVDPGPAAPDYTNKVQVTKQAAPAQVKSVSPKDAKKDKKKTKVVSRGPSQTGSVM